jgi:exodeoxyribonuclease V beta subunit
VKATAVEEEREDEQRLMYVAVTRAMGRLYLPGVTSDGEPGKVRGPYDSVHRRVFALLRAGSPLVSLEPIGVATAAMQIHPAANDTKPETLPPPVHVLRREDARDYALLRARHAGARVTSYTRMRSGRGRSTSAVHDMMRERSERRDEKGLAEAPDAGSPVTLRSARASGVFVHELLERVPLASFSNTTFDAWRASADVAPLFDEALAIHRVDPAQRAHAEELVWRAYATSLVLPGGKRIERIADASRVMREMDFVFSVADTHVFARGSLDLAFEHEGLTYFADWKTDSRSDYTGASLAQHVLDHYGEQVRLYALAVVKLLDLGDRARYEERFGGLLYCFLRGMDGSGAGVWSARPSWDEVQGWGEWLRKQGVALQGGRA